MCDLDYTFPVYSSHLDFFRRWLMSLHAILWTYLPDRQASVRWEDLSRGVTSITDTHWKMFAGNCRPSCFLLSVMTEPVCRSVIYVHRQTLAQISFGEMPECWNSKKNKDGSMKKQELKGSDTNAARRRIYNSWIGKKFVEVQSATKADCAETSWIEKVTLESYCQTNQCKWVPGWVLVTSL